MLAASLLSLLLVSSLSVSAVPVPSVEVSVRDAGLINKRGTDMCGQWDTETENSGHFLLYNNMWGQAQATSYSQCTQATSSTGTGAVSMTAWKTVYKYTGGAGQVKSYPNVALQQSLGKKLSAITSIPSSWNWKYTTASSDLIADVSYDMWLGTSMTATSSFEIMVWLSARGGALPAGSKIATVSVGGHAWSLYKGYVGTWTVYSYVSADGEITAFKGDLKLFMTYLTAHYGVSTSLLVTAVQAGTEPFSGSATLTTTSYRAAIAA